MPRQANCIAVFLSWSLIIAYIEAQNPLFIRVEPERAVYTEEERVTLRCVAESITNIRHYTFFKDGVEVHRSDTNILTYKSLQIKDSGMHACTYTKEFESSPEASIYLRVVERPPSPLLFEEQQKSFLIKDENAVLRCQPPREKQQSATAIHLYYNDRPLSNSDEAGVLNLTKIQISSSGKYSCIYEVKIEKRAIESYPSNVLSLTVIERPHSPLLLVERQRNVLIRNESTILICQPPRGQMATAIHLYQNERPLYNSDNGVIHLTNIQITSSGNYSCIYEVKNEGQTVESYLSNVQSLTVIDLPPTPKLRYAYNTQNQSTQVELACEVVNPSFSQIHGYHFYHNGIKIGTSGQVNHFILNYNLSFNGCYFCRTYVIQSEQEILSPKSSEVFLSLDGQDERQCQEEVMRYNTVLSKQGLKLYGSILAGKLLVLSFILIIFGFQLLVIRQRNQKSIINDH